MKNHCKSHRRVIRLLSMMFFILLLRGPGVTGIAQEHTFTAGDENFLLDGSPFQVLAGEMHFARIPKEYWRHRLQMARAMGLNTVAMYVFWNYHEPEEGKFDFTTENRDIAEFIRLAQQESLWVIVRPGPYACAEWEFGGYPWWLLRDENLVVRGRDPKFLEASRKYLTRLGEEIAPLQVTRGGPVIMVQVENEYGSFGDDRVFMGAMRDYTRQAGFDVPLFTADGPGQCRNGYVEGVLPAINGDVNPVSIRDTVKKWNAGKGPFFSPEFYPGWLDHWGEDHSIVPAEKITGDFEALVAGGISVNLYMFHGGTNFGFTNGANYGGRYQPQPTSYDYDAPLDEAGRPTDKYFALRDVILRHLPPGTAVPDPPPVNAVIEIAGFELKESAGLFDALPPPVTSPRPLTMEEIGQGSGYTLYRSRIGAGPEGTLSVEELRDYGVVFVDGKKIGSLDRRHRQKKIALGARTADAVADIFIENGGRINYGRQMVDNRKGITDRVTLDGTEITGWEMFRFPMADLSLFRFSADGGGNANGGGDANGPVLRRGTFSIGKPGDTFLDMGGWGKGCVWVNGHNLGRFWYIGPQQTLYLPGVWLKEGLNEVIVLELEDTGNRTLRGVRVPVLNTLFADRLAPPPPVREPGVVRPDSAGMVAGGSFVPGDSGQEVRFTARRARYFCLESMNSLGGDPFASAAELYVLGPAGDTLARENWKILYVDSEELRAEDGRAENAIDGDPASIWHTLWGTARPPHPHYLVVDMGALVDISGFIYLSRRGNSPGKIMEYRFYLSGKPFPKK